MNKPIELSELAVRELEMQIIRGIALIATEECDRAIIGRVATEDEKAGVMYALLVDDGDGGFSLEPLDEEGTIDDEILLAAEPIRLARRLSYVFTGNPFVYVPTQGPMSTH